MFLQYTKFAQNISLFKYSSLCTACICRQESIFIVGHNGIGLTSHKGGNKRKNSHYCLKLQYKQTLILYRNVYSSEIFSLGK